MTEDGIFPQGGTAPVPASADDIAQRTAVVLGDGPRIQPIEIDELSDGLQALLSRMATVNDAIDSPDKVCRPFSTFFPPMVTETDLASV